MTTKKQVPKKKINPALEKMLNRSMVTAPTVQENQNQSPVIQENQSQNTQEQTPEQHKSQEQTTQTTENTEKTQTQSTPGPKKKFTKQDFYEFLKYDDTAVFNANYNSITDDARIKISELVLAGKKRKLPRVRERMLVTNIVNWFFDVYKDEIDEFTFRK